MLLCTKTLGCGGFEGHGTLCDDRLVKDTSELVTISYPKDGKTYMASMPSDHAEWVEERLSLDLAEVERAAAKKAWDRCREEFDAYSAQLASVYIHSKPESEKPTRPENPYRRDETE